jgi:hypothetical protein
MNAKILNLTLYPFTCGGITIPPSGLPCPEVPKGAGGALAPILTDEGTFPLIKGGLGAPTGLPPEVPGVLYLVPTVVAQAAAGIGRRDFVSPGDQAERGNPGAGHLNLQTYA